MTKNEMTVLKMNILGGMNEYVKNLSDENAYMAWIDIVPDECTEDDLLFIATDDELWADTCRLFGSLVKRYSDTEITKD